MFSLILIPLIVKQADASDFQEDQVKSRLIVAFDEGVWDVTDSSFADLRVRERLFGIWKTTSMRASLTGRIRVSTTRLSGTLSSDLSGISSDNSRRDAYVRENLFNSSALSIFSCRVDIPGFAKVAERGKFSIETACRLGNVGSTQRFDVTSFQLGATPRVTLRGLLKLDDFGVRDVSQKPIVLVSRLVNLNVTLFLREVRFP